MLILTPQQKEEFLQFQSGQPYLIEPLPISNSPNYAVSEAFLGEPDYTHLHEFLAALPTDSVILRPGGMSLEQAKAEKLRQINAIADQLLNELVSGYPVAERSTWPEKIREAENFAEHGAPGIYLPVEAEARGVSISVLAAKVLEKSHEYHLASAKITGDRGRHTDAVSALQTPEEVLLYDLQEF